MTAITSQANDILKRVKRIVKQQSGHIVRVVFSEDIEDVDYVVSASNERPGGTRWAGLKEELANMSTIAYLTIFNEAGDALRRITIEDEEDHYSVNQNSIPGLEKSDTIESSTMKDAAIMANIMFDGVLKRESLMGGILKQMVQENAELRKDTKRLFDEVMKSRASGQEALYNLKSKLESEPNSEIAAQAIGLLTKALGPGASAITGGPFSAMNEASEPQVVDISGSGEETEAPTGLAAHKLWSVLPQLLETFSEQEILEFDPGKIKQAIIMAKKGIEITDIISSLSGLD